MHILVTGWFSFENMGNTAGDMIARDLVCGWLKEAGLGFNVAVHDPRLYEEGVHLENVNPADYTDLIFVCGPFGNGWPVTEMLERFSHCRLTGINLSLLEPLETWNPFTILFERDSSESSNPDITMFADTPKVPVVGVIHITKQDEYGKRDLHLKANEAIDSFVKTREMAVVRIDTVIENNKGGLKTSGEIEALIAKMDVVITTRLHGTVLALKNGVPVIPIDPVAGGAKVSEQVKTLGWPILFQSDSINMEMINEAFNYCLSNEARLRANTCGNDARIRIEQIRLKLISKLMKLNQNPIASTVNI